MEAKEETRYIKLFYMFTLGNENKRNLNSIKRKYDITNFTN